MEDPYSTRRVNAPLAPEDWAQRYARVAGFGVYLVAALGGFALAARPTGAVRLLTTLAIAWAIPLYCALDARAHGKVFVQSFWLFTVMTWPVAPLFHLIHTRGKRGALLYLGYSLLVGIGFALGAALGSLLA